MSWEATVLELLSASLLRPFSLVATAALVIRLFRVEHPASKHAIWAAVLAGTLILPFVSVMAPHLELQALPQGTLARLGALDSDPLDAQDLVPNTNPASQAALSITDSSAAPAPRVSSALPRTVSEDAGDGFAHLTSGTILFRGYCFGLLVFGVYRAIGWLLLQRLISRSSSCASAMLRESNDVMIPIAVGLLRPSVILPAGWRQWTAASRRAVLAHEFAHIRRGDAWVSFLSRVVKSLLWFHPLSWYVTNIVRVAIARRHAMEISLCPTWTIATSGKTPSSGKKLSPGFEGGWNQTRGVCPHPRMPSLGMSSNGWRANSTEMPLRTCPRPVRTG